MARSSATSLALSLLSIGVPTATHAQAPLTPTSATTDWQVYGAPIFHETDQAVPGRGVVAVKPRPQPGEPWSSGAGMVIPQAIAAGERVTAVFWARAARPTRLVIGLQGGEPAYARFGTASVTLTPAWQRVSVSGTAPTDFAANSQSLSVQLGQAGAEVKLGPAAFLYGTADDATITRIFAAFRPAEIAVDVRIPSAPGVMLAGTLHLPARNGHFPVPLVVLIQGHGPNGRGGFPAIIKQLTAHGVAALEYDKRGVGQSSGLYKEDLKQLTADAAAAVAMMRHRPDIDARRVALLGHSQGGVIAPAVAAADPTIAAIVMLAGSVGDGFTYLRRALRNQMVAAGKPKAAVDPAVDSAITLLQARIDGRDARMIAPLRATVVDRFQSAGFSRSEAKGALAMIDTEEVRQASQLRSASDLKALRIPVLAVFASKDPLVVASDEAAEARRALAGNPRGSVVVLDGLSHWFQEGATTGGEEEVGKLGPNAGSPRLVALVGDWLGDALIRHPDSADRPAHRP